ncbi:DUF1254 domain-containing protein [Oceanicaulis alexandrii]|uniref:DUF1254 domain-containing protein n=1 Tax=Oceanicaulis alexandrii TaxID=153233 RepID=UPI00235632E3|nr:DUF1214 domain-containing protein [Oceanicaulis alexandrii]
MMKQALLTAVSILGLGLTPVAAQAQTPPQTVVTSEVDAEGREALAYSLAIQAYLYTYPLFIWERERLRRENLREAQTRGPIAPINRLGHMNWLANANSDMPYSPNNDTVYTGVSLDLRAEPIILDMPEIKDRYAVVQSVNAYMENQTYHYSPRVNGGEGAHLAFVGPDWEGELPDGVQRVDIDTPSGALAIRLAVQRNETDLATVRGYQNQMSLTPLSAWDNGPTEVEPAIPAPVERETIEGPFAHFHQMAVLLAENPPPPQHAAMNATLWRLGLEPGQGFDPDALDPDTRAGILRAIEDGPAVMEYLRRNRGQRFPTGWDTARYADDIVFDYAARAAISLVGLLGNDPEEAIYFYTFFDSENTPLDGSESYRMHFEPEDLPEITSLGFWSVTMYDGETFLLVDNPIDRYSIGSRHNLQFNDDGSLDLYIQPEAPGGELDSNWLPSPEGRPFRVTFRIYSPKPETTQSLYDGELALPPLIPASDQ